MVEMKSGEKPNEESGLLNKPHVEQVRGQRSKSITTHVLGYCMVPWELKCTIMFFCPFPSISDEAREKNVEEDKSSEELKSSGSACGFFFFFFPSEAPT